MLMCVALLLCVPLQAALILSLDQPVQTAMPGDIVMFTGSIVNSGPEAAPLGVSELFTPPASSPFSIELPLALAGFMPGPGESYAGTIFSIFVSPTAIIGDSILTVAQITADLPGGGTLTSNGVTAEVTVSDTAEPGSATLLALAGFTLLATRRFRR
jgi:hypothetical protein